MVKYFQKRLSDKCGTHFFAKTAVKTKSWDATTCVNQNKKPM